MGAVINHTYDTAGRLLGTTDAEGNVTSCEYDSLGRKIRMVEPNMGTTLYKYDDVGNLIEHTDAKMQVIQYSYDELNRITSKLFPGTEPTVVYQYDLPTSTFGKRRLSKVSDGTGTTEYNYDNRGNMAAWRRTVDTYQFSFQATYDEQNRLQQMTYPDGYKSRNYYSDSGFIRQVRLLSPNGFFGSSLVTYGGPENGSLSEITRTLGNGVVSKIGYVEGSRRPTYVKTYLKNDITFSSPVQDVAYSYTDVGLISQITDNLSASRSESFTYDGLSRLTQAQSGMYGTKIFAYTVGGNMTQNGSLQMYFGNDTNCTVPGFRPAHAVCADSSGNQYSYDLSDNMTSRQGRSLEYDSQDRLTTIKESGITKLSFTYDHSGERIKKIRPDGAVTYSIGGLYEVQKKTDGSEVHTKYFMGISGDRIAQVTRDSSQVTLAGVTTISNDIFLASGNSKFTIALGQTATFIGYLFKPSANGHVTLFLFTVLGSLFFIVLRAKGENAFAFWQRLTAMPALALFVTVVFIDCSGSSPTDNGIPWETTMGSTTGIPTANTTLPTYNDTTLAGLPVIGTFFLVPNHVGSSTLITDSTGTNIVSELHYTPYGEVVASASTGPDFMRHTFTGQTQDVESSLMNFGARYYDPKLGRFISADTTVPNQMNTLAYNRYMYVYGNPVHLQDPTGHTPYEDEPIEGSCETSDGLPCTIPWWHNFTGPSNRADPFGPVEGATRLDDFSKNHDAAGAQLCVIKDMTANPCSESQRERTIIADLTWLSANYLSMISGSALGANIRKTFSSKWYKEITYDLSEALKENPALFVQIGLAYLAVTVVAILAGVGQTFVDQYVVLPLGTLIFSINLVYNLVVKNPGGTAIGYGIGTILLGGPGAIIGAVIGGAVGQPSTKNWDKPSEWKLPEGEGRLTNYNRPDKWKISKQDWEDVGKTTRCVATFGLWC